MKLLDKVLEKFGIVSKEFDKKFCETFETPLDSCIKDLEKDLKESSEKLERKIGEKFDYKGITLEVIVTPKDRIGCNLCFFDKPSYSCGNSKAIRGVCGLSERADRIDVHFIKVTALQTKQPQEGFKLDQGKLSYTLLPFPAITEVVKILMFGEQKYGRDNWQKVANAKQRYLDACLRHCVSYCEGETYDLESGKHHLAHAVCCLLFILWFDLTNRKEEV